MSTSVLVFLHFDLLALIKISEDFLLDGPKWRGKHCFVTLFWSNFAKKILVKSLN